MARRYEITPPANRDLEDILRYVAENSGFDRADDFLLQFTAKLRQIAAFPNMGKPRQEWGVNYRSLLLNNYLIIYRVTDGVVEILRVMSGYRDLDNLFQDN
jgi:toxin ParE1/3/4